MIVIAEENERRIVQELGLKGNVVVVGVGSLNVINSLKDYDKGTEILNVGYVGSRFFEKGTIVRVRKCKLKRNINIPEPEYIIDEKGVTCITSNDFIDKCFEAEPCVYDMELAYILSLGFQNVKSIKVVSDNLSLSEYHKTVENGKY